MKSMLTLVTLLVCATIVCAEEPKPEEFKADASSLVGEYASQQSIQYLGKIEYFDDMNRRNHLTKKEGHENQNIAYGIWVGENSSGQITVFASFPGPEALDKDHTKFWVRFDYTKETPMPDSLLSQLTAKAVKTTLVDGSLLELVLSKEMQASCLETRSMHIRASTGAPVFTGVEDFCEKNREK